jgi:hypothetical protein
MSLGQDSGAPKDASETDQAPTFGPLEQAVVDRPFLMTESVPSGIGVS